MDQERKIFSDILDDQKRKDARITALESFEFSKIVMIPAGVAAVDAVAITSGVTYTSANLLTILGAPASAKGVIGSFWTNAVASVVYFSSSPNTPQTTGQRYANMVGDVTVNFVLLPVGLDGKITVLPSANVTIYLNLFGYWL